MSALRPKHVKSALNTRHCALKSSTVGIVYKVDVRGATARAGGERGVLVARSHGYTLAYPKTASHVIACSERE